MVVTKQVIRAALESIISNWIEREGEIKEIRHHLEPHEDALETKLVVPPRLEHRLPELFMDMSDSVIVQFATQVQALRDFGDSKSLDDDISNFKQQVKLADIARQHQLSEINRLRAKAVQAGNQVLVHALDKIAQFIETDAEHRIDVLRKIVPKTKANKSE